MSMSPNTPVRGMPSGAAHHSVGLLDRESAGERLADRRPDPEDAQAVGDEAGRVVAAHDGLPQPQVADVLEGVHRLGPRVLGPGTISSRRM